MQIAVIFIEPNYWLNVGCWLSSALSYVKKFVDLVFTLMFCVWCYKNIPR